MVLEIVFGIFAIIFIFVAVYFWFQNRLLQRSFEQRVKEFLEKEEVRIRTDAAARSGRVLSGKTLEKLVPFLDKFPYDPHDVRWIGDPVDLVIFDGNSAGKINKIVFCEVKSGSSHLTKNQNEIKKAVLDKKVGWSEFRTHDETS
ncbi:MAG: Holliday junction resolvase [Candidatus Aenigmarchaeota archaeon]|nr:Holliday junction resolvase [Candidatus Aenigmarchaeota archaeon]